MVFTLVVVGWGYYPKQEVWVWLPWRTGLCPLLLAACVDTSPPTPPDQTPATSDVTHSRYASHWPASASRTFLAVFFQGLVGKSSVQQAWRVLPLLIHRCLPLPFSPEALGLALPSGGGGVKRGFYGNSRPCALRSV